MLGEIFQTHQHFDGEGSTDPDAAGSRRAGSSPESVFVLQAFVLPGLVHPFWRLAAPGPNDPLALWVAISCCFLSVAVMHHFRALDRTTLQKLMSGVATLVTVHLFLLAFFNDMAPFYAIGSVMSVLATVLFIRSSNLMVLYSVLVIVLSLVLYLLEPDPRKLAYWCGTFPVLLLAYHRLTGQVAQRSELESQVAVRTAELSEANQRLRDEIERRTVLEDQLRITQKMEAVGRLAGGVAHDFNNLLTTIGVYAELVLGGLSDESPLRREVKQIQKANQQAAALTHQLLTLGRRSHVPLEPVDLNDVVMDSATMLRHLLGEDTRLELTLSPDAELVFGNQDQLQQILINLCINARDAMPGSGRVCVETRRCSRSELERLDLDDAPTCEEYVQLAVEDTGQGMDPECLERAFDPFFTTKDPEHGAGLGLSIVHGIVSQAGGHAWIDSEMGRGTRLELYWPLVSPEPLGDSPIAEDAPVAHREELLLVEDEADLRDALARVLHGAGYRITDACCAEDALEICTERGRAFDLVVTDVVMSDMSGVELAERLLELDPDTKVLLVSGHLNDRVMSRMPGHLPFLAKPFSAAELTERVRQLLGQDAAAGESAQSASR